MGVSDDRKKLEDTVKVLCEPPRDAIETVYRGDLLDMVTVALSGFKRLNTIEEWLEKMIENANDGVELFAPARANPNSDEKAFIVNLQRRSILEDTLKVVRGEEDSIGDAA